MSKLSHPARKYYAQAIVKDSDINYVKNYTAIAMGDTKDELNQSKALREQEAGIGKLKWQTVDIDGQVVNGLHRN